MSEDSSASSADLVNAYIAGILDAEGSIRVGVASDDSYKLGYAIRPKILVRNTSEQLVKVFANWCAENGITAKVRQVAGNENTFEARVTRQDDVQLLLELMYPYVLVQQDDIEILRDEIFPRLDRNEHSSPEGFIELMGYVDQIASDRARKYDRDFFIEKFDVTKTRDERKS